MEQNSYDVEYKIVLVGEPETGKTWFVKQFRGEPLPAPSSYAPTEINDAELCRKTVALPSCAGVIVRAELHDTMSENARFRRMSSPYHRAKGVLLFVDVTNRASFENAEKWFMDIWKYTRENCHVLIVANKIDDVDNRKVGSGEIEELIAKMIADENNEKKRLILMMEVSVKNNINVQEAVQKLCETIYVESGEVKQNVNNNTKDSKDSDKQKDKNCKLQ